MLAIEMAIRVAPTSDGWVQRLTQHTNEVGGSVLALLRLGLTLLAGLLVIFALFRIWTVSRRHRLVVEDFRGGTFSQEGEGLTKGISVLAREHLVEQLARVRDRVEMKIGEAGLKEYSPDLDRAPLSGIPRGDALGEQLASLGTLIPEIGPALTALRTIGIRPRGDIVFGILQEAISRSGRRVGITLQVSDLRSEQEPTMFTIWFAPAVASSSLRGVATKAREGMPGDQSALAETRSDSPADSSSGEDFIEMLPAAMRWLALEVAQRSILQHWRSHLHWRTHLPFARRVIARRDSQVEGNVHNFIGLLWQGSARTFPEQTDQFLDLAVRHFATAKTLLPRSYQPYENLAETLLMKTPRQKTPPSSYLDEARSNYGIALYLSAGIQSPAEREAVERRILVGRSICDLLSDDSTRISESVAQIRALESSDWSAATETEGVTLYQLACWYGLAFAKGILEASEDRLKGRRYLAYCVARTRDFWFLATVDEDTESIRGGLESLEYAVEETLIRTPNLQLLFGDDFVSAVEESMATVGWP